MKLFSKSFYFSVLVSFILGISLTSCNNFLQGADLKESIENTIEINSQKNPLKITKITPEYASLGVASNLPIEIHFNQEIDTESFCKGYKILNEDADYTTKYEKPYFSYEYGTKNTVVVIRAKNELSNEMKQIAFYDMKLVLSGDITSVTESGKLGLSEVIHKYRIVYAEDAKSPPVVQSLSVYKNKEKSEGSKLLSTEITDPEVTQNELNTFFTRNHVSKIWCDIVAYDVVSEISIVRVTEIRRFDSDGKDAADSDTNLYQTYTYNLDNIEFKGVEDKYGYWKASFDYTIQSLNDGIYQLIFSVLDEHGDESQGDGNKFITAVKDSTVSIDTYKIYNNFPSESEVETYNRESINEKLKDFYIEGTDFYQSYNGMEYTDTLSDVTLEVKVGKCGEELHKVNCSYESSKNRYTLKIDSICVDYEQELLLKITDSCGNVGVKTYYIPPMGKIVSYKWYSDKDNGALIANEVLSKTQNEVSTIEGIRLYFSSENENVNSYENELIKVPFLSVFNKYGLNYLNASEDSVFYECLSEKYNYENKSTIYGALGNFMIMYKADPAGLEASNIPQCIVSATPGPLNSALYNIEVEYLTTPGNGVSYYIRYAHSDVPLTGSLNDVSNSYEACNYSVNKFPVKNKCDDYYGKYMNFQPFAVDAYGRTVGGEITSIEFDYDNIPPTIPENSPQFILGSEAIYIDDYRGLDADSRLEYWFIPVDFDKASEDLSQDFIEANYKMNVINNITAGEKVILPLGGLPNGLYKLYARIYDSTGNYTMSNPTRFDVDMLDEPLSVNIAGSKLSLSICNADTSVREPSNYCNPDTMYFVSVEYFNKETGNWEAKDSPYLNPASSDSESILMENFGSINTFSTNYTADSFAKINVNYFGMTRDTDSSWKLPNIVPSNTCYLYTGSNTCTTKKLIVSGEGIVMTKSDKPYIVQTLSSPVSYGREVDQWERYGIRQNCQWLEGTDIYQTKQESVECDDGYWCIIVHWADGTSDISDIWIK